MHSCLYTLFLLLFVFVVFIDDTDGSDVRNFENVHVTFGHAMCLNIRRTTCLFDADGFNPMQEAPASVGKIIVDDGSVIFCQCHV